MVAAIYGAGYGCDTLAMTRNRQKRRVDRRTVLRTLGGVAIGASGLVSASAPAATVAGERFVRAGVNTFDNDGGGADLRMVRARNPAGSGTVTHATSGGTTTTDYATSIVPAGGVAFGDLTELSYEYYGGERNRRSAPDEVWALLETASGERHVVFRHAEVSNPAAQRWQTRDVLAEIRGDSSLSPDVEWTTLTDGSTSERLNVQSVGGSLVEAFGTSAVLRRIGVGRGRTGGDGTVADTYYRNLRLNGKRRDAFPASERDGLLKRSPSELPKEVVVTSSVDRPLDYVFEVTGELEKLEPNEDTGDAVDEVAEAGDRVRVEGTVGTGDDRFAFSGELVEVEVPPEVNLEIRRR